MPFHIDSDGLGLNSLVIYTRHKSVYVFVLTFKQEESKRFSNENHAVPAGPDWIFKSSAGVKIISAGRG